MDQKRIDELGIELGRSLAAVVQHALSIAAEASKGAPLWVNVGTAAQSFTKPVETEQAEEEKPAKKPARKRATRKTAKAEEPKAEEPKAEEPKAEEPKAEEPKADLLAIKEIGQKIMAYKGENPWVEEECAKAMGGKVLATLRESEIQPAYDALVKILNKLEGNEEPNGSMFA
ncbi:hypothetical protein [uncultured Rothia sp.]|uniref:hypothetical protein n=1 Tax=uncultured Rothia sp. TaxID=316088 RepID=UPI002626DB75|nr:hypothetical protein [uncultured Rothia sp.]